MNTFVVSSDVMSLRARWASCGLLVLAVLFGESSSDAGPPPGPSDAGSRPNIALPSFPELGCFGWDPARSLGACLIGRDQDGDAAEGPLKASLVLVPLTQTAQLPPTASLELLRTPIPDGYLFPAKMDIPWPSDKEKLARKMLQGFVAWPSSGDKFLFRSDAWFKKVLNPKRRLPITDAETMTIGDAMVKLEGRMLHASDEHGPPFCDAKLLVTWPGSPNKAVQTVVDIRGSDLWDFQVYAYKANGPAASLVFEVMTGRGLYGPRLRETSVWVCAPATPCRPARP